MPSRQYQVTVGEQVLRVQVRREADAAFVRVDDGEEVRVDWRSLHGALHTLRLGDQRIELLAAVDRDGEIRMAIDGLEFAAEVVDEARARLASVAGVRGGSHTRLELKSPMPGLLVRVLCSVGDEVQASQPLVVLQAMKMENELSLPRGGTVSAVRAEAGQTVEQGQVLVVVE
ncbi:MAG TPA: biotin/lipoyl-containing protein [Chloroflexota bacterium]